MNNAFKKLLELGQSIQTVESIERVLFWDQETMMPKNGITIKTMQKSAIASIIHQKKTSQELEKTLKSLIDFKTNTFVTHDLDEDQKRCTQLMRDDFLKAKKLPDDFIQKLAVLSSEATHVWIEARKENDFKRFLPYLEQIIDLMKQKSDLIGFEDHPYDAHIDDYEPGMTTRKLTALFTPLKKDLIQLTKDYQTIPIEDSCLYGEFDESLQMQLCKALLIDFGLNPDNHRLDESAHPFCMPVHRLDLRLTTHLNPSCFYQCISSSIHECGHALYEQGHHPDFFGLPIGQYASMGIHESQSKFYETMIGQSHAFWKGFYPKILQAFPDQMQKVSLDSFYRAINKVSPSLIRIYADEVTYSLHIILRFEIEKAFMDGSLKARELPEYWKTKMQEYLGIIPHNDSEGCLQDIHWASALFGYFPTYALGNLYAAELFNAIQKSFPDLDKRLENGDYHFLKDWLGKHVHEHGRRYTPERLIERATGQKVTASTFIAYLKKKYEALKTL